MSGLLGIYPNDSKMMQNQNLLLWKEPLIFTIFAVNLNCGAFSHNGAFFLRCFFITELFFHSALYSELFIAVLFQNRAYYASAFIGGAFLQHDRIVIYTGSMSQNALRNNDQSILHYVLWKHVILKHTGMEISTWRILLTPAFGFCRTSRSPWRRERNTRFCRKCICLPRNYEKVRKSKQSRELKLTSTYFQLGQDFLIFHDGGFGVLAVAVSHVFSSVCLKCYLI